MRRVEMIAAALLVAAVQPAALPAQGAAPFPLAPCRIGAQALTANTPLMRIRSALTGAFPRAKLVSGVTPGEPDMRRMSVVEGGETLLQLDYYPRAAGQPPARLLYRSPRFQLAPGVGPGTPLARIDRTAGPVRIGYNPEIGVETLDAPGLEATFAAWEGKGCTVNPRLGPGGRVGLYPTGATETRRFKPGARIAAIEIGF